VNRYEEFTLFVITDMISENFRKIYRTHHKICIYLSICNLYWRQFDFIAQSYNTHYLAKTRLEMLRLVIMVFRRTRIKTQVVSGREERSAGKVAQ